MTKLARDIEPGEITERCLHLQTQRIAALTRVHYAEALETARLNPDEFILLAAIAERGGVRVKQATSILDGHIKGPKKVVDRLARRGLISLSWSRRDARVREISLTETGETLLNRAIPLWYAMQEQLGNSADISTLLRRPDGEVDLPSTELKTCD
ncbi:MAG: winged helix-turn-helix transcriptional regulator [Devosiaceae bacterium]|nr:winged helix-turn-helix transcriptional regulator [Devosiaceae bacterium MH13]